MEEKSLKWNAVYNSALKASLIILPLITFPYITRTVHAENYGKLSFCYSIISYFDLLAALGISSYAIREGASYRNDKEKINKFASEIYTINVISTVVSYFILGTLLFIWHPEIDYLKLLLIYSIEIVSTTISVEWVYNIYEEYLFIAIRTFLLQVFKIVMVFLLIHEEDDYYISAIIDAAFFLLIGIINHIRAKKIVNIRVVLSKSITKHLKPILVLFTNTIMVSIYVNSDITMLGIMQSDTVTGIYRVSAKIYSAIKAMINGVTMVTIPRLASYVGEEHKEKYDLLLNKILIALVMLVSPICVGLVMTSRNIITIVSGEEYLSGALSLMILGVTLCVAMFSNILLNAVLIIYKNEKKALKTTSLSSVINVLLNVLFIPTLSLNGAALTTLISEVLVMIMAYYYAKDLIHIKVQWNVIKSTLFGCLLIIGACLLVGELCLNTYLDFIFKIVLSSVVYFVAILSNRDIRVFINI